MGFRRPRQFAQPLDIGMVVFLALVCLWVLSRINFFLSLITAADCMSIEPALLGREGHIDGMLDMIALAGLAAIVLVVITGIVGWQSGAATWGHAAFGAVNIGISSLLIAQWVVAWSFFHPDSWLARIVMASGPRIDVIVMDMAEERPNGYELTASWNKMAEGEYFNAEIGIAARKMSVSKCFPAEFVRENFRNMYPNEPPDSRDYFLSLPNDALEHREYAYVYFDQADQYLTSELYWWHRQYPELMALDAERDADGRKVDPQKVWELVRASLVASPVPEKTLRPYSRDEIENMVRQTWDREAPLP